MDAEMIAEVVGIALSIAGFGFTIIQLKRTTNATEAATNAIKSLKNRMATHDLIAECLIAAKSLQFGAKALISNATDDAISKLMDAQASINRISVSTGAGQDLKKESSEIAELLLERVAELENVEDGAVLNHKEFVIKLRKFANKLEAQVSSTNQEILL